MPDLSILVPSRNEMFLSRTVKDVLTHAEGDTEVIVVLDGPSPHEPPPDGPRVRVVQLQESIGQRAATNLAARMSEARYVMKADAHCAFDQGFDVKMMADMQDDWTVVPIMRNLHVFNWLCPNGHRRYQGPSGPCQQCGEPTEREIVWISKTNPQSTSYCFDAEPHFQYFGQFKSRPEGKGDLTETMSLQGSCWMLTREKYWELNICDEAFGSWGSQGIECAVKTWLSGGRVIVNHKTYYAHAFRTAGGDWSFPYEISGRQVEHAKHYARELFFENKWPKQIHPLSWLVEKFWPVPGWSDADMAKLTDVGTKFAAISLPTHSVTGSANPLDMPILSQTGPSIQQGMPMSANVSPGPGHVLDMGYQPEVGGVAASPVSADVLDLQTGINNGFNQQGIGKTMGADASTSCSTHSYTKTVEESPIASFSKITNPVPAISLGATLNTCPKSDRGFPVKILDNQLVTHGAMVQHECEIVKSPTKGLLYYSDNRLSPLIMSAVQRQLLRAGLPIISVTLKPMDFGQNIVLDAERSILSMYRQILMGLEASTADVIWFAEHDVLLHLSHFDFTPSRQDIFSYDGNFWQVDAKTGHALTHVWRSTSGLCAYRELLLEHYRKRVQRVEQTGYNVRIGHEPGTHNRPERIDDYGHEMWMAAYPSIDIRHGQNLTPAKWTKESFRNQRYTEGWREADEVPGWGTYKEAINGIA